MALSLTTAAGGLAVASYLNAKYGLGKDINILYKLTKYRKAYTKAEEENRVSSWYIFEETCRKYPDNRAIWSRDGIYTYSELHERVVRWAQWLLVEGVRPGQLVAVYMKNRPELMMIWFALVSIGAAPAFINYNLEGKALMHCLTVSEAKLLIVSCDSDCQERIERSRTEIEQQMKIVSDGEELQSVISSQPLIVPGNQYRDNVKGSDPLCLLFTSGTTGLPKGAPFSSSRLRLLGYHIDAPFEGKIGVDRVYNAMPLYHGTGGINCYAVILYGLGIAIGRKFSASGFFPDVCESESTVFVYVGETVRYLLNMPSHPLERKHKLRVAYGNGLRPDVWQKFQDRFNIPEVHEFFNSSEGMFGMLVRAKGPYLRNSVGHHGLILQLLLRNQYVPVKIDHETGGIWRDPKTGFAQRVPYEEGGEILVFIPDPAAPELEFKGYWKSESATEKKLSRDVFQKGDLYYRTGDALRRTPDGHWLFMDRLGDTYRWKSENVSTAEVAEVLGNFPGIAEANVYGVSVPNHEGRAGCAALHMDPNAKGKLDYRGLYKFTKSRLPRYAVPVFLRLQQASSHIHNGKQNKVLLRTEGVDPELIGKEDVAGKNDTFLWVPPKHDTYVEFKPQDWKALQDGSSKL